MDRATQGRTLLHLFYEEVRKKVPKLIRVVGSYTGSGDSMDSSSWQFFADATGKHPYTSMETVELQLSHEVEETLDSFMMDWVNDEHPGWENNDGGHGELTFNLETRSCVLEHNQARIDYDTTIHTAFDDESA